MASAWESLAMVVGGYDAEYAPSPTLTEKTRFSHPEPAQQPRPPMRARGNTDGGVSRSNFYGDEHHHKSIWPRNHSTSSRNSPVSPVSPRVVVRQASVARIGPVSAPPSHELPPPPPAGGTSIDDDYDDLINNSVSSASSFGLTFASSTSSQREVPASQPQVPRKKEKKSHIFSSHKTDNTGSKGPDAFSQGDSQTPSRTLKKATSHQSLGKRGAPTATLIPSPPPELEKAPRKQRSFHHPRLPIPPIPLQLPLRHTSSFGSVSGHHDGTQTPEQAKGAPSPPPSGRKRLFSGASLRRPSTSQGTPVEDDVRSVLSLPTEAERALYNPFSSSTSSTGTSFWVENMSDQVPQSPAPTVHEYTPQQIMSPAEMLKVEASVQASDLYTRPRGLSIMSSSTVASDLESNDGVLPPQYSVRGSITGYPSHSSSVTASKGPPVPPQVFRLSTASQANVEKSSFVPAPYLPTMTSLPPPPRPRAKASSTQTAHSTTPPGEHPRKSLRGKLSVEKVMQRRSLMRKPSFLDIDDETDKETDTELEDEAIRDSFLDLARESFDTMDR